jgi:hypothetical protein
VVDKVQASKKSFHYRAGKSVSLWIEILLVGYFGHLLWLAYGRQDWGSLPFLSLFFFGFLYVSAGSVFKRFSMAFFTAPKPPNDPAGQVEVVVV